MAPHIEEAQLVNENHELRAHGSLEQRIADCEAALALHNDRMAGFDAALAAHVAEEIEIVEIEAEDGAQVDVDTAETEGGSGDAEAGGSEGE